VVIAMITTGLPPAIAPSLSEEQLFRRAVLDHVEVLLRTLQPCATQEAIRLLGQLSEVLERRSRQ
jgi:hypothetical protein